MNYKGLLGAMAVIAVVLASAAFISASDAAGGGADDLQISLAGSSASSDGTVIITLNVDSNPGFYSMRAYVDYDSSHMTLKTVSAGSDLQTTAGDTGSDPYPFYIKNTTIGDYTGTGAIATFTFSLSGSDGEQYAVRLIPIEAVDTSGEDVSITAYGVMATNGSVAKGDVNGDGKVSLADSLLVDKYLAGYRDLGVSTSSLDVNGDGKVSLADSLLMDRYFAGYDVGISAASTVDVTIKDGSDTQTVKGGIEGRTAYIDLHSSDVAPSSTSTTVKEYRSGVYSFTVTKGSSGVCALEIQEKQAQSRTVTYVVDGTVRHTETHAVGDSLTAWSYSQTGKTVSAWSPSVPSTMPDSDLTVRATTSWVNYTLTYRVDGSTVHTETHHYGDSLTAWTYSATGKTVSAWNPSVPSTMPASNLSVSASTTSNTYTVTYSVDGAVKHVDTYSYGASITAWKYTETGKTVSSWSPSLPSTMPARNISVSASTTAVSYSLSYVVDNTVRHTEYHHYGDSLTAWSYSQTGKTVSAWSPSVPSTMPASNLTVKATTTSTTYTLTYVVDGTVRHTESHYYGDSLTEWKYSASGRTVSAWSPSVPSTMPASSLTVYATTTSTGSYTITYIIDGVVKHTDSYAYGANITAWKYSEVGKSITSWSPSLPTTMPAQNLTVRATSTLINYTLTYVVDGATKHTEIHNYGDSLTAWKYSETGKTVSSWNPAVPATMPATDLTIKATTSQISYTLTYVVDGATVHTETHHYGDSLSAWTYSQTGKTVSSWSPSVPSTMPANDLTVRATTTSTTYTLTYVVDGSVRHTESHNYGDALTAWEYSEVGKTVSSWSPSVPLTMPARNLTVSATTAEKYQLTFVAEGKIVSTRDYGAGETIPDSDVPAVPAKANYSGTWVDLPATMPASNLTVTAHYRYLGIHQVSTPEGLQDINKAPDENYRLTRDIDLSTFTWSPFEFSGNLDGNGKTISGLKIIVSDRSDSGRYYVGLFSENSGTIKDLTISGAKISVAPSNNGAETYIYCGVVTGYNTGTIDDVEIIGADIFAHSTNIKTSWTGSYDFDKVQNVPTYENSSTSEWTKYASLDGKVNSWEEDKIMDVYCGGIAGYNTGTISDSSANARIDAEVINFRYDIHAQSRENVYVGGIIGYNTSSKVSNCSSSGSVFAQLILHDSGTGSGSGLGHVIYDPCGTGYVGGLVGYSDFSLTSSAGVSDTDYHDDIYAPKVGFLKADYSKKTCNTENIHWYQGSNTGN